MEDLTKNFDKLPFEYDVPYGKITVIRDQRESDGFEVPHGRFWIIQNSFARTYGTQTVKYLTYEREK
jgi:hypothetical protein